MKRFVKIIFVIISLPVLYLVGIILLGTLTDYKPEATEQISKMEDDFFIDDSATFSMLIWNIGYCGLGAEMDFFYDGGKKVRDSEDNTRRNEYEIAQWLLGNDSVDFMLLQEVDKKSRRSYKINQVEDFNKAFAGLFPFYASNYRVKCVPVPLLKPMGKVESGLLTLSKHVPVETIRYSFPGNYAWPKSTFMLDRCFLLNRYKLHNGKELLIINTHNSAYDDGTLRSQQKACLKEFLQAEQQKENYIIVGGDWNECPPSFKPNFPEYIFDTLTYYVIDDNYLTGGWQWIYDSTIPTNRRIDVTYNKELCAVTLIDFYLASPNIEIISCKGIPMDFKYSDHNPVLFQFRLKV